jgi:Zn-dependent M28 family amino/carboxypeptidase
MDNPRVATRNRALRLVGIGTAGALSAALLVPAQMTAAAGDTGSRPGGHHKAACEKRSNNTYRELLRCVTRPGVMKHLRAFQKIADNSTDPVYPGTRAAGTDGYDDSVRYVARHLRKAGYRVELDPVEITFDFPAVLRQLTPTEAEYETGVFTGSGSGEVEGAVHVVDLSLEKGEDAVSTSGCEAADFEGFDWSGDADIALVQRGTCFFGTKAAFAEQAGAEAVIIMNQGNTPEREELFVGDATSVDDPAAPGTPLPDPVTHGIPVVGASFADGLALADEGSTAYVNVLPAETRTDQNVIAELPGKNEDNVVMAGAHLDSVTEGPGINDDGSGTAALLETALMMANSKPENTLRFGFWAAEEQGLVGSTDYVTGLSDEERGRIALYMNYDMIGSPNYIFMVYDADESTFPAPEGITIPEGSEAIEDVYEAYYTLVGEPYDDTAFDARSDYQAFIEAGIPAGGLFTGAEEIKTEEQEAIWGGVAGEQFDPCYHEDCDTVENVDLHALEVNSDLVAFAMLTFAYSTESVNGVEGREPRGKQVELPVPAGPEGTFVTTDGGLSSLPAA